MASKCRYGCGQWNNRCNEWTPCRGRAFASFLAWVCR